MTDITTGNVARIATILLDWVECREEHAEEAAEMLEALAAERDALSARLAEAEAAPKGFVALSYHEAVEAKLAEANAKITQMSAGWGEDAVRVEELRKELTKREEQVTRLLERQDDQDQKLKDTEDRAEAAEAREAKLRDIGDKMAASIEGNYFLPGIATAWRKARAALQEKPHE